MRGAAPSRFMPPARNKPYATVPRMLAASEGAISGGISTRWSMTLLLPRLLSIAAGSFCTGRLTNGITISGRKFPDGKRRIEDKGAPIADARALEQGDVAPHDAAADAENRMRFANL